MPLGDSITEAPYLSPPGGYRIELFRQALTDGKKLTFIGRKSNGPTSVTTGTTTTPFPQGHEGYSGYTTAPGVGRAGITPLVDGAIAANRPQIVLLMIGTNDVDLSFDLTNAPARLGTLMDKIIAAAPDALLVVAKIIPLNDDAGNIRVKAYNDAIPGLVADRAAAGKHVLMVDMNAPFVANGNYKTALLADKWHPTSAGYLLMAQTWFTSIKSYLP